MKAHTKVYIKALGYHVTDFMPCEVTGQKGVDVHHIVTRKNRIENLMLLTREVHARDGDIKSKMVFLLEKHREFLSTNGVDFDNDWFEEKLNRYRIYDSTVQR